MPSQGRYQRENDYKLIFILFSLSRWVIMSPPNTISLSLLPTKGRFPFRSRVVVVLAARDKAVGARLPIRVGVVY